MGYPSRAVLPYDQRLLRLPAYLQQLDMELNGKRVTLDGAPVASATGPVVWGEPGTNGQHAFYQLIHQGTDVVPCEFLVAAYGHEPALDHHQQLLLANCLAQSEALMRGRTLEEALATVKDPALAPHKVFPGNRPSTTLVYPTLDPAPLGRIIALYEHRVFVEGVIWGINSFDQWGVELGKELATALLPLVETGAGFGGKDGSTAGLLEAVTALRELMLDLAAGAERLVHADGALLVWDKPSGLLSVPAKPPGPADCLEARARAAFPEALLVHRLDRDTSGVMVFARTKLAQRHLGWQFERRQVAKVYVARVAGEVAGEAGRIELPLVCDWPNRPKQMVCHRRGKPAAPTGGWWRARRGDAAGAPAADRAEPPAPGASGGDRAPDPGRSLLRRRRRGGAAAAACGADRVPASGWRGLDRVRRGGAVLMADRALAVRVSGTGAGGGYRAWAQGVARRLGLRGWVRNLADGSVAAVLIGPEEGVEGMIRAMRRGPPDAEVEDLTRTEARDDGSEDFRILR